MKILMEDIPGLILFVIFLSLWIARLRPSPEAATEGPSSTDKVVASPLQDLLIIIPCRNEERVLPELLDSLEAARREGAEILVVDDQSTDATFDQAYHRGVRVCRTEPKPETWSGKNWACHSGYQFARRQNIDRPFLLFTDADTLHTAENLKKALVWFQSERAQLMTARPYHRSPTFWEKALGPFYLLILSITLAKKSHPSPHRFFSIGQFLLFQKEYYESSGGHETVRSALAEDLALARVCLAHPSLVQQDQTRKGLARQGNNIPTEPKGTQAPQSSTFVVYPGAPLYATRMYATPMEFFRGWQRNFRLGMPYSSIQTWIETILIVGGLLNPWNFGAYLVTVIVVLFFQKTEGSFSVWGALFFPLSGLVFLVISLASALDQWNRKPILWKTRAYRS